jgi:hypothetical protein
LHLAGYLQLFPAEVTKIELKSKTKSGIKQFLAVQWLFWIGVFFIFWAISK